MEKEKAPGKGAKEMKEMDELNELIKSCTQSGVFSKEGLKELRYFGNTALTICDAVDKISEFARELKAAKVPDILEAAIEHRGSLISFQGYLTLLLINMPPEKRQQIYDILKSMQKDKDERKVVIVSSTEQGTGKSSLVRILNDLGIKAFEDSQVLKIELDRVIPSKNQCEVKVHK